MVRPGIKFIPVTLPVDGLDALARDARREGFTFLDRLVSDWHTGTNRFDRQSEILLGAFMAEKLVAVGGLNIDPYANDGRCGRLRHVYVSLDCRGRNVGRNLVGALVRGAGKSFDHVRLRTDTAGAATFYCALGFLPLTDQDATHVLLRRLGDVA